MHELSVTVRPFSRGLILDMKGDLTKASGDHLLKMRDWAAGGFGDCLVLNFAEVPYLNSSGIAALLRLVRFGMEGAYRLYGFGLTSHYQRILRLVGLTEQLALYPDEYSLLQQLGADGAH